MTSPKVQLTRLLATHYTHTDLAAAEKFYDDFGLIVARRSEGKIHYRGFGDLPYIFIAEQSQNELKEFAGGLWTVASRVDLETASRITGASAILPSSAPGGGEYVELLDPNGVMITLVHGIALRPESDRRQEEPEFVPMNSWGNKARKGTSQRPPKGPSRVHKLGHYGLWVDKAMFDTTVTWYTDHFTLAKSDIVYDPRTEKDFMVFTRIDLGEEYTDHHSLFFHAAPWPDAKSTADHSSFEVDNLDTQLTGHDHLINEGYTNAWGIGRHVMGSQIFDYWFDPSGFVVEHYSDGDVMNNENHPVRQKANADTARSWGPNVSKAMMTGRPENAVDESNKTPMGINRPTVAAQQVK